jgi:hypothetical protein
LARSTRRCPREPVTACRSPGADPGKVRDERDATAVTSLEKYDEAKETADKAAFAK